jgi:hypothetical protein
MTDSGRAERVARNEAYWRELNAELKDLQAGDEPGDPVSFVCECGRPNCVEILKLTLDDYERRHRDDRHFVVKPGHEFPEVERVIESTAEYSVVEKRDIGEVQDVVQRS